VLRPGAGETRRAQVLLSARSRWHRWIAPLTIVALLSPMLFTDRTFGTDWANHLWLVWNQGISIHDLGHPSYFLQSTLGAFYPFYAFYGGSLYAATGLGSDLAGDPIVAFVGSYAVGATMAYGGLLWLARQAGVRGWQAHMPAVLFVTSAYYVTNIYGRGAWPETMATSALPLVLAAAVSILSGPRPTVRAAAALVLGVALLSGSHNITLLWSATALVALAAVAAGTGWRRAIPPRRLAVLGGLSLLGLGVNLWFLLPDLAYAGRVRIAPYTGIGGTNLDGFSTVFGLLRDNQPEPNIPTTTINPQTPVLALVWAAAGCALSWRVLDRAWHRLIAGVAVVAAALTALILLDVPRAVVPDLWGHVQFGFRLQTYVTLIVCLLVIAALRGVRGLAPGRRVDVLAALGSIVVISVAQALDQAWSKSSTLGSRSDAVTVAYQTPPSWYAGLDYSDASLPVLGPDQLLAVPGLTVTGFRGNQTLSIPVTRRPQVSAYTFSFPSPGAGAGATHIPAGPYLVGVHGASAVGRTFDGLLAIGTPPLPGTPTRVTFGTAGNWAVRLGQVGSLLSLALAAAGLVAVLGRRRRGLAAALSGLRRRPPPGSRP